ncbi:ribonuclease Z [Spirochaetia bacterium 38H-sp]|uniref:Ribonuclease Z n=1 Tax=Rarispira pelagica TaxID=3141764 RepID=A0ABU9UBP6_9SPIR
MNLEAFILGTGGMMPLPHRFLTSMLLRREGDLFLFDCGEGTQVSLRALNLRWKKISAIFISHTHADHVTGLPGILMLSSQVDRNEPLFIYGPPKVREYVEMSRKVLDMYINYEIVVREIPAGESVVCHEGDGFCVRSFPLRHTKPCVGYTLEESSRPGVFFPERAVELGVPMGPLWAALQRGESVNAKDGSVVTSDMVMGPPRSGRKVSFVTDTMYLPHISEYVADSDLFVCEGMFSHELVETAREKRHLTAVEAATIARDAGGIGRLGLIHYSPRYSNRELKVLLKEAKSVFADTFLCRDGQAIDIPYRD